MLPKSLTISSIFSPMFKAAPTPGIEIKTGRTVHLASIDPGYSAGVGLSQTLNRTHCGLVVRLRFECGKIALPKAAVVERPMITTRFDDDRHIMRGKSGWQILS
jgi:hypothetical protein